MKTITRVSLEDVENFHSLMRKIIKRNKWIRHVTVEELQTATTRRILRDPARKVEFVERLSKAIAKLEKKKGKKE